MGIDMLLFTFNVVEKTGEIRVQNETFELYNGIFVKVQNNTLVPLFIIRPNFVNDILTNRIYVDGLNIYKKYYKKHVQNVLVADNSLKLIIIALILTTPDKIILSSTYDTKVATNIISNIVKYLGFPKKEPTYKILMKIHQTIACQNNCVINTKLGTIGIVLESDVFIASVNDIDIIRELYSYIGSGLNANITPSHLESILNMEIEKFNGTESIIMFNNNLILLQNIDNCRIWSLYTIKGNRLVHVYSKPIITERAILIKPSPTMTVDKLSNIIGNVGTNISIQTISPIIKTDTAKLIINPQKHSIIVSSVMGTYIITNVKVKIIHKQYVGYDIEIKLPNKQTLKLPVTYLVS